MESSLLNQPYFVPLAVYVALTGPCIYTEMVKDKRLYSIYLYGCSHLQ